MKCKNRGHLVWVVSAVDEDKFTNTNNPIIVCIVHAGNLKQSSFIIVSQLKKGRCDGCLQFRVQALLQLYR